MKGTAASGGDATTELAWLLRGALGAHAASLAGRTFQFQGSNSSSLDAG